MEFEVYCGNGTRVKWSTIYSVLNIAFVYGTNAVSETLQWCPMATSLMALRGFPLPKNK